MLCSFLEKKRRMSRRFFSGTLGQRKKGAALLVDKWAKKRRRVFCFGREKRNERELWFACNPRA